MSQSQRRRYVCHHEAGHALARWYFGHRTDLAAVLTIAEMRAGKRWEDQRGRLNDVEGIVEGYNISDELAAIVYASLSQLPDHPEARAQAESARRHMLCNRDVMLIVISAGIPAEAAYRHRSPAACGLEGGALDFRDLGAVAGAWFEDEAERWAAIMDAELRATALVRSTMGAAAIHAMAAVLEKDGQLDGDQIDELCAEAYGGRRPAFGSWVPHWPPRLADIRAGVIHEDQGREEQAA